MRQILIACGDVELLRKIVSDLPQNKFKPIATKTGEGIAQKIEGRDVPVAVIFERLADDMTGQLLKQIRELPDGPAVLYLSSESPPDSGPFDRALKYPVPGPVFRNALEALVPESNQGPDLDKWKKFYGELKARAAKIEEQNYFQILGLPTGAKHHRVQKAYDVLSRRYHPDRYRQFRDEKWGKAIHEKATHVYKMMTEAYGVLSDRKLRTKYEKRLEAGETRLGSEDTSAVDKGPQSLEDIGNSPKSKKFLKLAQTDKATGNISGAIQNLKFAKSMEPDNSAIQDKIDELEGQLE